MRQVDSSNLVKIIIALELKQTKVDGSRNTALGLSGLSHIKPRKDTKVADIALFC